MSPQSVVTRRTNLLRYPSPRTLRAFIENQRRKSFFSTTSGANLGWTLTTGPEAATNFEAFHARNNPYFMGPGRSVLSGEEYRWRQALIPFWVFRGTFQYQYRLKDELVWSPHKQLKLDERDTAMQTCGTFRYRHDFIDILKGELSRLLDDEIDSKKLEHFDKDSVEVTRGLAWDFVIRNVKQKLWDELQENHESDAVIRVRATGMPHKSKLIFLPAHVIEYSFGEKVDIHNERSKDQFYAMVGGVGGKVASEIHLSVRKAAMAGGGIAVSTMGLASLAGYKSVLGWSVFDYCFIGAGSAAWAALLAQVMHPVTQHHVQAVDFDVEENELDEQAKLDDQYKSEWARWENGSVGFDVQPEKRRRWAESIWNGHRRRKFALQQVLEERAEAKVRDEENQRRREQMEKRWGRVDSLRMRVSKRDRDWLGYYAALELDIKDGGTPTQRDIKRAFLRRVRVLHPDVSTGSNTKADPRWLKTLEAYSVLKDEHRRELYDRGERPDKDN